MIHLPAMDDERLAGYRLVADPAALLARGIFVAEGRLVVRRLLDASGTPGHVFEGAIASVLVTAAALEGLRDGLDRHPAVPVYVVPQDVMNDVAGFNIHRGCLALARRPASVPLDAGPPAGRARVVVLEGVNNPDNVGGIFRSAAAFGVDLIVLGPACADPLYRKSIRTSMGATLAIPWMTAADWPAALTRMRAGGRRVIALTPDARATPLAALPRDGQPFALVVGTEGAGLSAGALAAADVHATIPMTSLVDSLNVNTATAIALYHLSQEPHRAA